MSNLNKAAWGPGLWVFIHVNAALVVADAHAAQDTLLTASAMVRLLNQLPDLLPCPECRLHMSRYLASYPPLAYVFCRESASQYAFDLHNNVNARLGKKILQPNAYNAYYGVNVSPHPHQWRREPPRVAPRSTATTRHPATMGLRRIRR